VLFLGEDAPSIPMPLESGLTSMPDKTFVRVVGYGWSFVSADANNTILMGASGVVRQTVVLRSSFHSAQERFVIIKPRPGVAEGVCFGDSGGPFIRTLNGRGTVIAVLANFEGFNESGTGNACVAGGRGPRLFRPPLRDWIQDQIRLEHGNECPDIPAFGRCLGPVAIACNGRERLTYNCLRDGARCKQRARGDLRVVTNPRELCEDDGEPCIGSWSVCSYNDLVRCEGSRLQKYDCSDFGLNCVEREGMGAWCNAWPTSNPPRNTGCESAGPTGHCCNSNQPTARCGPNETLYVRRCDPTAPRVVYDDCALSHKRCGWDHTALGFRCM